MVKRLLKHCESEFVMVHVEPYLLFDGNCAEAMAFYESCLGGELYITRVSATPMKDQMPPDLHNRVVFAHLKHHSIEFSPPIGCIPQDHQSLETQSACT